MDVVNIIPTSTAEHLGKKLIGTPDIKVFFLGKNKDNKRYFPDGEVYVRIPEVGKLTGRTVVLHSGAPNPNSGLVELEMVLQIVGRSKAAPIEVFLTYFPYGKQDKIFREGETNAAKDLVEKLIEYYQVERVFIVDAHFAGREWVKGYPIVEIPAHDLLINGSLQDYPGVVFITPDLGGQRRTGLKGLGKKRLDSYRTEMQADEELKALIEGQVVGVVDDFVETGGTLIRCYEKCIKWGAKEVFALVTHGVLPSGIKKVLRKYSRLYLTNTIDREEANIDVSGLILGSLRNRT
jgi:ribose-phosphate pyrophosphokinase